jgi:hypothetical protein
VVRGGRREIDGPDGKVLCENADDWVLDLETWVWRRATDRRWTEVVVERADGQRGKLWEVSMLAFVADRDDEWSREHAASHRAALGFEPDLEAWAMRFRPPIAHEVVPAPEDDEGRWTTHRIVVDGVVVRYVDESRGVRVVVEGPLAADTMGALFADVRDKLGRVDHAPYVVRRLSPAA